MAISRDRNNHPIFSEKVFQLDKEVAVLTGAGSGIGRSIALHFAAAGAAVLVSDLDELAAARVAAEIHKQGGRAHSLRACLSAIVPLDPHFILGH